MARALCIGGMRRIRDRCGLRGLCSVSLVWSLFYVFVNDAATAEIYTPSLHDALTISLWVCELLMLICILTKNVITSCSVTMMLFLHLEVKPLMTLTTVLYLSCALISGHLAMMLMELTKRR